MRALALSLPLLLLAPSAADAGFVTYTTSYSGSDAGGGGPGGLIPFFDPTQFGNANLLHVKIDYFLETVVPNGFEALNLTNNRIPLRAEFTDTASLRTINFPLNDGVVLVDNENINASFFEIVLDPHGAFSSEVKSLLKGTFKTKDPTGFVGTGDYEFVADHNFYPSFVSQNPDIVQISGGSNWGSYGTITVTYTYATPAPPALVMVAGALPFGAILLRRRRLTAPSV